MNAASTEDAFVDGREGRLASTMSGLHRRWSRVGPRALDWKPWSATSTGLLPASH